MISTTTATSAIHTIIVDKLFINHVILKPSLYHLSYIVLR
jgi:hypothetical protein